MTILITIITAFITSAVSSVLTWYLTKSKQEAEIDAVHVEASAVLLDASIKFAASLQDRISYLEKRILELEQELYE